VIVIVLYAVTARYKKTWNIILLGVFVLTAISTLAFIFGLYGETMLWIHLRVGTVFLAVALVHTLWHWRYFVRVK